MTTYSPQAPTSTGVSLTWQTPAANDKVPPGVILVIRNTGGTTGAVTITTPLTLDGDLTVSDRVSMNVPITTGFIALKVPYSDVYRDPADGLVTLNFAGGTLTYAVLSAG